jgi:ferritin
MMSPKMQDAINKQIQAEFYSAYLYLAMAGYANSVNLKGAAKWLSTQFKEEQGHALKFIEHLTDRGGLLSLQAIDQPAAKYKSLLDVFEKVLEHEKKVTSLIHKLYALSVKEEDYALQVLMQWYITEQVEEEAHASEIVEKLRLIGDKSSAILYLDKELGKRE